MIRLLKKYTALAIIAAVIILLAVIFRKQWFPPFAGIFKAQPVVIDETPILIKEINELAQLCTITAFDEVVADSVVVKRKNTIEQLIPDFSKFSGLPFSLRRLVIIGKGKVVAGTNLKKLGDNDITILNDSVVMRLPPAEILDVVMNPSDFEVFSETGNWSPDDVVQVKMKARKLMVERALQQQILQKANQRTILLMENFLMGSGFKKATVLIED